MSDQTRSRWGRVEAALVVALWLVWLWNR